MAQTLQRSNDFDMPYRYRKEYGTQSNNSGSDRTRSRLGYGTDYYMHSSSAVAPDYDDYYEESVQPQQKKQKKTHQKHVALLQYIPVVLIAFALSLALVTQYVYIENLGYEVSHAKSELKTTQSENEKLKRQIASMGELTNVEAVAVNELGMHKPTGNEVIYLAGVSAENK